MKSVLVVIHPDRYTQLQPDISGWAFDRGVEGWSVGLLQTSQTSGYGLRADLAARYAQQAFDHLFLIGDMPQIWVTLDPDGHGNRQFPAVYYLVSRSASIDNARVPGTDTCLLPAIIGEQPYAHVGHLTFDGLAGFTPDQLTDHYHQWFVRRSQYSQIGCSDYPIKCLDLDHFDKVNFGRNVEASFAKYPKSFTWFMPTAPNNDDGQMHLQERALIYTVMSGGFNYGDGQYLDYWGRYLDLLQYPMQALFTSFYGSHICEWNFHPGSIVRAALVNQAGASKGCTAIASIFNFAGNFRFDIVLNGDTFGAAATASYLAVGMPLGVLDGDPTTTIDAATLARFAANETEAQVTEQQFDAAVINLQSQIDALQKQITPLLAASSSGGGGTTDTSGSGTTAGAIVILSATYRQVNWPGIGKDCTAVVRALVNAGTPWFVYADASINGNGPCLSDPSWGSNPKDPYPGIKKELVVTYTKGGGAPITATFAQFAQVVL